MRANRMLLAAGVLVALAMPTRRAAAQNIIWFEDYVLGTSSVQSGMAALATDLPGATFYDASSAADFFTTLDLGGWDLAVFAEQGNNVSSGNLSDISNYLASGGKWLGMTWVTSSFMPLLDAGFVEYNDTQITDNGAPDYSAIWSTSPIDLFNPGWGVFSQSYSTVGGAECVGALGAGCAAVLGNGGNSLLLGPLDDTYVDAGTGQAAIVNSSLFLLNTSVTPEPGTMALLATGLVGLAGLGRRRRKAS